MTSPHPYSRLPLDYQPAKQMLKDRVILVAGASQPHSLGRVAAMTYAAQGATVILHGRNIPKLEAAYDEIEALGYPQPAIMPLDFLTASQADLDGFADTIRSTLGRLDGLFHGASHFSPLTPMGLQGLEVWQQHLTVNLAVPMALTKACLPLLKRANDAAVIFLSETHAAVPTAYWGAFATSKNALHAATEIWSAEMSEADHVRFHVCVPGPVASPLRSKSHPGELAAGGELGQLASSPPPPASLAPHFLYLMSTNDCPAGRLYQCT